MILLLLTVFLLERFPPTINSYPDCYNVVVQAASKIVGPERASLPQQTMIAEDFAYFLQERPGQQ